MPDLAAVYHLDGKYLAHVTSAVQIGFIAGTLLFSILAIADRFSPSRVFSVASLAAAAANLTIVRNGAGVAGLLGCRFLTGFFLAGIYPVGMKIAADHYREKLGKSLGYLVGALVLGTAFPHLLKGFSMHLPWMYVILFTSLLSVAGGTLVLLLIPDGPGRVASGGMKFGSFISAFRSLSFRQAAYGYFGHMWEVYAFWAFIPAILAGWLRIHPSINFSVPLYSFLIVAAGSPACVLGGYIAQAAGVKKTAAVILSLSGCCCLLSPLFFSFSSYPVFIGFLFCWGTLVAADSPLFSSLVANDAPAASRGSALTMVNCIGFSITIISIQLVNRLMPGTNFSCIFLLLAVGPVAGIVGLFSGGRKR